MKTITIGRSGTMLLALALLILPRQASGSHQMGTAFTYQGELKKAGVAVTDACDFEFTLWDEDDLGLQMGLTESRPAVPVSDGLFTVKLDFGESVFRGQPRFLEIAVDCPGDAGFTTLSPRQELTPTPYAVLAAKLALPYEDTYYDTVESGAPAFAIGNTGTGKVLLATQSGTGDALKIVQSGPAGVGIDADVTNAANASDVITADTVGNGNVIKATTAGTGHVLLATQTGNGDAVKIVKGGPGGRGINVAVAAPNNSDVILATTAGNGNVIKALTTGLGKVVDAEINKPASNSEVIRVRSNGNGHGIDAELTKPLNNKAVFKGVTNGAGQVLLAEQTGDGDAVKIVQSGPAGVGIDVAVAAPNNSDVILATTTGDGNVINAATTGAGPVVVAAINNPNSPSPVVDVQQNGMGHALVATIWNANSNATVLDAFHAGLGTALDVGILNANSASVAAIVQQAGMGNGMDINMMNPGNAARGLDVFHGGIGTGISSFLDEPTNLAPAISALTFGAGPAMVAEIENPDNDADALNAKTDGTGQAIDAVITNPGSEAPVIMASGDHDGIGVFAYLHKPDNTGKAIVGFTEGTEAAGMFRNLNPGPGPFQFGILAASDGFSAAAAGVVAVGNGADSPGEPRAAALRIDNGAVTVSGETRPAGTIDLGTSVWFEQESCESFCPDSCFHKHQVSQYAETVLYNDYLRGDSIILLTVQTSGEDGDHRTYYAQVSFQTTGAAAIRVTAVGNEPACLTPHPGENIAVHYFIINPLDDV